MKSSYDVIVIGGGPSGTAAAVGAAQSGADTLLVERAGYLGGMATDAKIPAFCPFTDGQKLLVGGVGLKTLRDMQAEMWRSPFYDRKPGRRFEYDWVPIDTEVLKRVLDRLLTQSGCDLALHTTLVSAETRGRRLCTVTLLTPSGLRTVTGKVFVDCTGSAALAMAAGHPCECGDEQGRVQAATLCFQVANFDTQRFLLYAEEEGEDGNLHKACAKAREEGNFPVGETQVAGIALTTPGTATLNFGHVFDFDPFSVEGITAAECSARQALPELMRFLHRYVPGAEQSVLVGSGPSIGVRESRRIVADYTLTRRDYNARADFPDCIGHYAYPIDVHASTRATGHLTGHADYETSRYQPGEHYGIPYRSLVARELDNLLAGGRTIGSDRAMQGSTRVMPACFLTGQAAGTAAALCAQQESDTHHLNPAAVREILRAQGAIV